MTQVLVVDDEILIRELLSESLSGEGYQVVGAENGNVGLEVARQERPDIILLDVLMPVMDGFHMLRELRVNPLTRHVPVVLLTTLPPDEGESIGIQLGVSHYLTKPWDTNELFLT